MSNEANEQNPKLSQENQTFDLADAANRKLLAKRLLDDIDVYCAHSFNDGPRTHLGASKIGSACSRALWYSFRWVHNKHHSGQKQRLFKRGHDTEPRIVEYLRGIGCTVYDLDGNGEQYRVTGLVNGHFGGSLDGVNLLPERYGIKQPFLLEVKTNKTGGDFKTLKTKGVKIAKPVHFSQACVYGKEHGLEYCIYVCVDKNTDEIYIEVFKIDVQHAQQQIQRATIIINSDVPPPKLSESPTFNECKNFCDFTDICHKNAQIDRNCRSCKFSMPVEEKNWFCHNYQQNIPKEYIPQACGNYEAIV